MQSYLPTTPSEAVYATLAYFSLFQFPLTVAEISQYLLVFSLSEEELLVIVKNHSEIEQRGEYFFLKGQASLVEKRKESKGYFQKSLKRARRYLGWLQMIPFVRGIFLCNNLPFGIAHQESDIDLLIVTDSRHLYLARFLATAFLHLLGVRRHGNKIANRFCLSFYVTDDNLDFSQIALPGQDIYLAYWTLGLLPLWGKKVLEQVLEENRQLLTKNFNMLNLESSWKRKAEMIQLESRFLLTLQRLKESFWNMGLSRWLERKIIAFQKKKIHEHYEALFDKSGVVISDTMLKFHNEDKRKEYQEKYLRYFT